MIRTLTHALTRVGSPMSIEIIPTGTALGAEIRGVDLAKPIGDDTFAMI